MIDPSKELNEELVKARKQIEHAHQEWMAALDVVEDPIFLHDKEFRILRCNKAYQRCAGIPFKQIIGQPYYDVFPKIHAPLRHCLQAMGKLEGWDVDEEVLVGDTIYRSRSFPIIDEQGSYLYSIHTLEDTTERQHAKQMLRESEAQYRRLFEAAMDGILILDAETGMVLDANPYIRDLLSYSLSECTGKMLWEIGLFADIEASKLAFKKLQTEGYIHYEDLPLETKDGRQIDVDFVSNLYMVNDRKVIQCNIRDISERKHAEKIIQDEKLFSDTLIQSLPDIFYLLDRQGGLLQWNNKLAEMLGHSPKEMSEANALAFIHEEDRPFITQKLQEAFETGSAEAEARLLFKNSLRHYILTATRIETQRGVNIIGIGVDITERKQAEEQMRISQLTYEGIINSITETIYIQDENGVFLNVSFPAEKMYGYSREYFVGRTPEFISAPGKNNLAEIAKYVSQAFNGQQQTFEFWGLRKDGTVFPKEISLVPGTYFGKKVVIAVARDITERKQSEDALLRANRALKTLSAGNLALVRAANEDELLRSVMSVIVETGGYLMAWVGYAEDDAAKTVRPVAQSGYEEGYLDTANITWADTERGQGSTGTAIREGVTVINQDCLTNQKMAPWREAAIKRGYQSSIAIPLVRIKRVMGVLTIYSADPFAFGKDEVALLEELASDLAFGIETLRTRFEHEQHATILRQSLEQSIQTIAGTLEARDPYTAGHQRRVGELATAIAREMALPFEQVNGIHLAAIIHDLGKIHIPAEILSKPSRLTDIEFMLIKTHSQAGYDILKDVKFPWPIADIVLQHHERLDGSGYPQGLKGGQILLESKIMTVADVVEAMSSHRPYRPALGIEAALGEIERGRGRLYDPAVADACLKLFAKKGFTFSSNS